MKKVNSVEEYIEIHPEWTDLLVSLRKLLQETILEESIKWNSPVYSLNGKNILGFGAFKNHACIWFFQGVFLEDKSKILINAQEEKTKALRQWRFENNDIDDIILLKSYILEAIENQKLGKEIKPERNTKKVELPELLKTTLATNTVFATAFEKLTMSKQREYATYITEAKREATKQKRLEKIIPMIKEGKGLNDKYKNC